MPLALTICIQDWMVIWSWFWIAIKFGSISIISRDTFYRSALVGTSWFQSVYKYSALQYRVSTASVSRGVSIARSCFPAIAHHTDTLCKNELISVRIEIGRYGKTHCDLKNNLISTSPTCDSPSNPMSREMQRHVQSFEFTLRKADERFFKICHRNIFYKLPEAFLFACREKCSMQYLEWPLGKKR